MAARLRLGELLVEAKLITQDQLRYALETRAVSGRKLGQVLVELGFVNETQLTQALSQQLSIPWVSLYHVDFSRQTLNYLPQEIAEFFCMIPIFVRSVKGQGNTLYVAMDDPTNEAAIAEATRRAGLPVKPMIACPSDIRSALRVYYGTVEPRTEKKALPEESIARPVRSAVANSPPSFLPPVRGARAPQPSVSLGGNPQPGEAIDLSMPIDRIEEPTPHIPTLPPPAAALSHEVASTTTTPKAETVDTSAPIPAVSTPQIPSEHPPLVDASKDVSDGMTYSAPDSIPAPSIDSPDAAPEIEIRGEIYIIKGKGAARLVPVTLLDGTTLMLPARGSAEPEQPIASVVSDQLTARDLVGALRALAQGKDASEVLGSEPKWEAMFGALLSVLLNKNLIADWEFVDELRRM